MPPLRVFDITPPTGSTILNTETELVVRGKVAPSDKCSGFTAGMNPPTPPATPTIATFLPNGDPDGYHFKLTFSDAQLDEVSGEEVFVTVTALAITGSGYSSGLGGASYTIEERTLRAPKPATAAPSPAARKPSAKKKKAAPKKKAAKKKPAAKGRKRK